VPPKTERGGVALSLTALFLPFFPKNFQKLARDRLQTQQLSCANWLVEIN
jgi:hypothetical protein